MFKLLHEGILYSYPTVVLYYYCFVCLFVFNEVTIATVLCTSSSLLICGPVFPFSPCNLANITQTFLTLFLQGAYLQQVIVK